MKHFGKRFRNARSRVDRLAALCAPALLTAAVLVTHGCATSGSSARATTGDASFARTLRTEESAITTVRAYGTAQVSMPDANYTGGIDVSLRAPDSLRVKVTGPFGVLMGIVGATREHYTIYNAWDNTVSQGALAPGAPLPFSGFPFSFDDAMQFLRGLPPVSQGAMTVVSPSCVEGHDGMGRYFKCELDDNGGRKALIRDASGGQAYEYFRDFRAVNGVQYPYHIAAQLKGRGSVTIDFDEVSVNSAGLDFSVPIPSSATSTNR